MDQEIHGFVPDSCALFALGEPTHQEPAFGLIRNELLGQLAARGFRSVALETDRVSALAVDDFVREGAGSLDEVMRDGFSHGFGDLDANRRLVAWMREYNEGRPAAEQLAFHGFDAPTEMFSAPSPRAYLEYARDYLDLDVDLGPLIGDDERWSRTEAVMDPAMSIGATAEADKLRIIADDMLTSLYMRAPALIAATSRSAWSRARTHLTAGLGLLRYHRQCARPMAQDARISQLSGLRDAIMAQHLLDIRDAEARRGATFVFAHNGHLRRNPTSWRLADMDVRWVSAGAIVHSLVGEQYAFVAGSLGRSEALGLGEPAPDTFEGRLQPHIPAWGLAPAAAVPSGRERTDTTPEQGYFPLDQAILDAADAVLHISGMNGDIGEQA